MKQVLDINDNIILPGMKLRIVKPHNGMSVNVGEGNFVRVALVILDSSDVLQETTDQGSGVVIVSIDGGNNQYPYIWDGSRFEVVK